MTGYRPALLLSLVLAAASLAPHAKARELSLALANSTCDAMEKIENLYRASTPVHITHVCKSSGLLAKGLNGGVLKADIFVSADRDWMDYVVEKGLVDADQITSLWGNVLVIAAPVGSPLQRIDLQDLASDRARTILIGDPSNAPFGRHAKEALEAAGLWNQVKGKIETRKNIELLADSLAASSPDTVGILFKSNLTDRLKVLHTVRKSLHTPIRYYMAPLKATQDDPDVMAFLRFMQGKAAREVFQAEGFDVSAP